MTVKTKRKQIESMELAIQKMKMLIKGLKEEITSDKRTRKR